MGKLQHLPPTTRAYVWLRTAQGPVLAGQVVLKQSATGVVFGEFQYHPDYVKRPGAVALDPLHLPLKNDIFKITGNDGVPSALLDAGPDGWGKRILHQVGVKPGDSLGYLIAGSGAGTGRLLFSDAHNKVPEPHPAKKIDQLMRFAELLKDGKGIPEDLPASGEFLALLRPGAGLGGVQPKSNLEVNGQYYVAKFKMFDEKTDISMAEHMTMTLGRRLGVSMAETKIQRLPDGAHTILVKRFDTTGSDTPRHYLSARSLLARLDQDTAGARSDPSQVQDNYVTLAAVIDKVCADPIRDKRELFKRMTFNVLSGNRDDHMRNTGFLMREDGKYELAPAFDVNPMYANAREQQSVVGNYGTEPSRRNVLSAAASFSMSDYQAAAVYDELKDGLQAEVEKAKRLGIDKSLWGGWLKNEEFYPSDPVVTHEAAALGVG